MTTTQETSRSPHRELAEPRTPRRSSLTLLDLSLIAGTAYRNLVAGGWKTVIVGSIICFGTTLVVVGASLLRSTIDAMQKNITGSLTGDLQVYSAASEDEIDVLGGMNLAVNLATIPDYASIRAIVEEVPNVAAVVPLALETALVSTDSTLDRALAELRSALHGHNAVPPLDGPEGQRFASQKARVKELVSTLFSDLQSAQVIESTNARDEAAALQPVSTDEFWSDFDADPFAHLEQLENRVASVIAEGEFQPLRYVGTDPSVFKNAFERIELVDCAPIAPGERGFMLAKFVYEEHFKLKTARRLDKIKRAIDVFDARIATDPKLQGLVNENVSELRGLLLQLDATKAASVRSKLQGFLHSTEHDLTKLFTQFLTVDDDNFQERYRFFYDALVPELELYSLAIGDDIILQAVYRNGYIRSAKLKVTGTYRFKGLEDSPQAGAINMMDLVSFRELHGLGAAEHDSELRSLQAAAAVRDVSRERAEADLFGTKQTDHAAEAVAPAAIPDMRGLRARHERTAHASYDPRELASGAVTSVAIKVRDDSKIEETGRAIEAASRRAGQPLKAAAWHQASGVVGQFANVLRTVVLIGAFIILAIALVVINNALVMATLGRVQEFGTLRALGAQRGLILSMLLLESAVLGAAAGGVGALLGTLVLAVLRARGIPAGNDTLTFVYGGPRLYPSFGAPELALALVTVLAVSLISALYPAWLAGRVSPREAMQAEE